MKDVIKTFFFFLRNGRANKTKNIRIKRFINLKKLEDIALLISVNSANENRLRSFEKKKLKRKYMQSWFVLVIALRYSQSHK